MGQKRYAVITFRGYVMASSFLEAKSEAKKAISGIVDDGFGDNYRWARIVDRHKHLSRVVTLMGNYRWYLSAWLYKLQ